MPARLNNNWLESLKVFLQTRPGAGIFLFRAIFHLFDLSRRDNRVKMAHTRKLPETLVIKTKKKKRNKTKIKRTGARMKA